MAGGSRHCQPAWPDGRRRLDGGMGKQDKDRAERLAAALRENLRKRKAQARASDDQPDESKPSE